MAATNSAAIDGCARARPAYSSSSDCPDQNCCSKRSASRRAVEGEQLLDDDRGAQMEASGSPTMTNWTTG
jgi:hypothetical protein